MALLSQGVALGYLIMPRWGGRPVLLASLANFWSESKVNFDWFCLTPKGWQVKAQGNALGSGSI